MYTILIAEDEVILREVIVDYLRDEGYKALEASDGEAALQLFECHGAALVILDIGLPKVDGWSVCRRIRKNSAVPIIMLTARSDEDDFLMGYELGADDYLTKPYSPKVLMAKVKRILEKRPGATELSAGRIVLNMSSRLACVCGEIINLTHTEFEILAYLMRNREQVISREQLITKIWGYDFCGDERTVNSHIRNLRAKLGNEGECIVTVIRSGYRFSVRRS